MSFTHEAFFLKFTKEQWMLLSATGVMAFFLLLPIPKFLSTTFRVLRKSFPPLFKSKKLNAIQIGPITISDEARLRQTQGVGATGTGKTALMEQLILQDIIRGYGSLIIDPKGDRELYNRVKSICKKIGRESDLKLLSATHISESVRWNPCRLGGASELQTKWFQSGVYLEPFYAKACEHGFLQAFNCLIREMPNGFTLTDLVSIVCRLTEKEKDNHLKGLQYELLNLTQGELGEILCCSGEAANAGEEISLLDITRKNEILFVDLPTEAKAVQSSRLGKLLLQELMLVSGLRKMDPFLMSDRPFSVFIDEFDAFATEGFATFLNKGRSSNFMIHIFHQTLSDLDRIGKAFRGQILGNCAVRFIFRQDDPDDAETWSRFIGTKGAMKKTFQTKDGAMTGMSSNSEVYEFRVSPDEIKSLKTGECIFSEKTNGFYQKIKLPYPFATPKYLKIPHQREKTKVVVKTKPSFQNLDSKYEYLIAANPSAKRESL